MPSQSCNRHVCFDEARCPDAADSLRRHRVTFMRVGIVKLRGIAMIDPQHTWFATGLEPIILGVGQPDSA